jgi:hypothetical protein
MQSELDRCPCCGQSLPVDDIEAEVGDIRQWCGTNGIVPVLGDCIRLQDAARYLDRKIKTVQNWLYSDPPFRTKRLHGRVYVGVEDLAKFVCA